MLENLTKVTEWDAVQIKGIDLRYRYLGSALEIIGTSSKYFGQFDILEILKRDLKFTIIPFFPSYGYQSIISYKIKEKTYSNWLDYWIRVGLNKPLYKEVENHFNENNNGWISYTTEEFIEAKNNITKLNFRMVGPVCDYTNRAKVYNSELGNILFN